MEKCPVCGKQVDPNDSPKSTYQGEQYSFCCDGCKRQFDQNPAAFAQGAMAGAR